MEPFKADVVIPQIEDVGNLIRSQLQAFQQHLQDSLPFESLRSVEEVYATGDGDSWHAAMAVSMAFNQFSGVRYHAVNAMRYLTYLVDALPAESARSRMVVGISASGGSTRVVQSLQRSREVQPGMLTVGMVGNPDSRLAAAAERTFPLVIPDFGSSPGVRTYVASLLGGYLMALHLGEAKGVLSTVEAAAQREQILVLSDVVDATVLASREPAQVAAQAVREAPFLSFTGSGPAHATAAFSSAKVVEVCGLFATAQDLEEWVHIEHHAYPTGYPMYMIAPPGRSYQRAAELAYLATLIGHPLIAVGFRGDTKIREQADHFLPIAEEVPEGYGPLVDHVPVHFFAAALAEALQRTPFMLDNVALWERMMAVNQQIQRSQG